jgi:diguanylate cyclase (GGDEF)-like protein
MAHSSVKIDPLAAASPDARVAAKPGAQRPYAPISQFLERPDRSGRRTSRVLPRRLWRRLRSDPHVLLAIAIAVPAIAIESIVGMAPTRLAVVAATLLITGQIALGAWRRAPTWLPQLRLAAALAFVLLVNAEVRNDATGPLRALIVPIVVMAAASGGRGGLAVALAGIVATLVPMFTDPLTDTLRQRTVALAACEIVLVVGSRRLVASLERTTERLRSTRVRDRRRARQLGAVELVGRALARQGPTPQVLDDVMELLERTFGFTYPSVYTWDGSVLRLGAQRNYRTPFHVITPDSGVLGRVVRSHEPAFVPDVQEDPDYRSAEPSVVSEISIPLLNDGELLGILNAEAAGPRRLDNEDFATMKIVADRVAAALALGRERQKLTERAALLDRLTAFSASLNVTLDPAAVRQAVVTGAAAVIDGDMIVLTLLDVESGEYRAAAMDGGDDRALGARILPGEGISGRAIAEKTLVVDPHLDRARFPRATQSARLPDVIAAMAVPLVRDETVSGALAWFRGDTARLFTDQEREMASILGAQVALALANASLHHDAQQAATTDALTGLPNRRSFDAEIDRMMAVRSRIPVAERRALSLILFDLDHFGNVNKQHGHQVGDLVLVAFADALRSRVRETDVVARHGGEEFLVVLDGATRDDAVRLAEEIRIVFRAGSVLRPDGTAVACTVSAGCASLEPTQSSSTVLLERADVGLGLAKEGGRNRVVAA